MMNFKIFMNPKPAVADLISKSSFNPVKSIKQAKKGVDFKEFDDWRQMAYKSLDTSPHSVSWRLLALKYPDNLLLKELPLFFKCLDELPFLREQVLALIFKLPVKKLPKVDSLEKLPAISTEQVRVKKLLIEKKRMGDKKFYQNYFSQLITDEGDGQVSFLSPDGNSIKKFPYLFSFGGSLAKRRLNTIFGSATLVVVDKGHYMGGIYYYLLPDGYKYVKRICLLDYKKINIK